MDEKNEQLSRPVYRQLMTVISFEGIMVSSHIFTLLQEFMVLVKSIGEMVVCLLTQSFFFRITMVLVHKCLHNYTHFSLVKQNKITYGACISKNSSSVRMNSVFDVLLHQISKCKIQEYYLKANQELHTLYEYALCYLVFLCFMSIAFRLIFIVQQLL